MATAMEASDATGIPLQEDQPERDDWVEIRRRRSRRVKPQNTEATISGSQPTPQRAVTRQPRLPPLPRDDFKIIIRPRGALNLANLETIYLYRAIAEKTQQHTRDRPNSTTFQLRMDRIQNIAIASTPSEDLARHIRDIPTLRFGDNEYEVTACIAAPDDSARSVAPTLRAPRSALKSRLTAHQHLSRTTPEDERTLASTPGHAPAPEGHKGQDRGNGLPRDQGSIPGHDQATHNSTRHQRRSVNHQNKTRIGNSVSPDTCPDFTMTKRLADAKWCNTEETLGSDHCILITTIPLIRKNSYIKKTRLVNWDYLIKRWRRQKHYRTLKIRIARLTEEAPHYAVDLMQQNWQQFCNNLQGTLGTAKT
ncbi:hypothetical protein HPB47_025189 [Ixodes persulcatus]|uniref:Uncharacterized protein n=1 Tax=Ixodes persulcatus TaxID=34615 RepID=A0AC60Q418_IXOPE|nr:hypothetical protein HPB47_025189 [Ixodes persulcatus]